MGCKATPPDAVRGCACGDDVHMPEEASHFDARDKNERGEKGKAALVVRVCILVGNVAIDNTHSCPKRIP